MNNQTTSKAATPYENRNVPPKLITVKELVKAESTYELQSQLFALAKFNLTLSTKIVKKEAGVVNFITMNSFQFLFESSLNLIVTETS